MFHFSKLGHDSMPIVLQFSKLEHDYKHIVLHFFKLGHDSIPIVFQFLKLRHDFMIFSSNHVPLFEAGTRLNAYRASVLETET